MSLAPGPRRSHKPFFDSRAHEFRRVWRRLCRRYGGRHPLTLQSERTYHSHVRSQKRVWALERLNDCISLFHSNSRQFWRMLHGSPVGLPVPLRSPGAWSGFAARFQGLGIPPHLVDVSAASLSLQAFPRQVPTVQHALNAPFTLQEVDMALARLHSGRAPGFSGCPAELFRFAAFPRPPQGPPSPHVLAN